MSTRKKWRLKLYPSFRILSDVFWFSEGYATGSSPVHQVDVEVSEGYGWQLYERVVFPPRQGEAS